MFLLIILNSQGHLSVTSSCIYLATVTESTQTRLTTFSIENNGKWRFGRGQMKQSFRLRYSLDSLILDFSSFLFVWTDSVNTFLGLKLAKILISVQCHLITNVRLLLLFSVVTVYIDILIQRYIHFVY